MAKLAEQIFAALIVNSVSLKTDSLEAYAEFALDAESEFNKVVAAKKAAAAEAKKAVAKAKAEEAKALAEVEKTRAVENETREQWEKRRKAEREWTTYLQGLAVLRGKRDRGETLSPAQDALLKGIDRETTIMRARATRGNGQAKKWLADRCIPLD
jgi:hypothetical protein